MGIVITLLVSRVPGVTLSSRDSASIPHVTSTSPPEPYEMMDGVLPLALAVTTTRAICEFEHSYPVVGQGRLDHALRRRNHNTKPSHDQALSVLLTS